MGLIFFSAPILHSAEISQPSPPALITSLVTITASSQIHQPFTLHGSLPMTASEGLAGNLLLKAAGTGL